LELLLNSAFCTSQGIVWQQFIGEAGRSVTFQCWVSSGCYLPEIININ